MSLPIPKPPGPNGNPPPYDPKADLAERCAKAEAELERVKIERDEALVARDFADAALERVTADRDNETKWAKQYHDDWVKVRDELERVKKREAAMREALAFTVECAGDLLEYNGSDFQFHMRGKVWSFKTRANAALQPDAGSDYIRREDVKPLVESLQYISTDDHYPHPIVLQALELAKSLGL